MEYQPSSECEEHPGHKEKEPASTYIFANLSAFKRHQANLNAEKGYWDDQRIWAKGYFFSTIGISEKIIKK